LSYSLLAKKLRLPLGFVLGIGYLLLAPGSASPEGLTVGAIVALVGVFVRGWAAGHIVKNKQLATTGPYAHTRNPLYFGSFLIGAGFAIAAHVSLILVVVAFWLFVYAPTMGREREGMRSRFPEDYGHYERNVPMFFPRMTPWSGPPGSAPDAREPWSLSLYMRHGEWRAALVYVLAIGWLWYFMEHPLPWGRQ
jgi:protein-S-isoprenylcysteine O-methyltransferase Ste14